MEIEEEEPHVIQTSKVGSFTEGLALANNTLGPPL